MFEFRYLEIEGENHFLWQCEKYRKEREILFKKYLHIIKNFQTSIMIQWNQNYYLTVNRCELTNYAQTLYQIY
jgi:hypothetical protein